MRNASCADIVYELEFYVDQRMQIDRTHGWATYDVDPISGGRRQLYNHEFMSPGEWTASVLVEYGVLAGKSPFFWRLMSLEECECADFSDLESPHNYMHCMFTFEMVVDFQIGAVVAEKWGDAQRSQMDGLRDKASLAATAQHLRKQQADETIPLERFSPRFLDRIVYADDVFSISNEGVVAFDRRRYEEKLLTRWRATDNRYVRRNSAQA